MNMRKFFVFFSIMKVSTCGKKTFMKIMKCWYDISLRVFAHSSINACICSLPWLFTGSLTCFLYTHSNWMNRSSPSDHLYPLNWISCFVYGSSNDSHQLKLSYTEGSLHLGSLYRCQEGRHGPARYLPNYANLCLGKWVGGRDFLETPC